MRREREKGGGFEREREWREEGRRGKRKGERKEERRKERKGGKERKEKRKKREERKEERREKRNFLIGEARKLVFGVRRDLRFTCPACRSLFFK